MRMSRAISIAALALTTIATAAGCGADDTPQADPSNGTATSAGADATTPSESSGPDVPPDWQVASVKAAQLQVPPDWALSSTADLSQTMRAPNDAIGISPGAGSIQVGVYSNEGTAAELEELATRHEKDMAEDFANLKRLPNETINGQVFYHLRGDDEHVWYNEYGSLEPDGHYQVLITWNFNKTDIDRKGAEALIAQVMQTYKVL